MFSIVIEVNPATLLWLASQIKN